MAIDPTLARGVQQAQIAPNLKAGFGLGQAIADEPTRKKRLGLGLREDQRNDKRSRIQDMQNTAITAYLVLGDNFDVNSLNVDNIDGTIDKLNSFVEIESSGDRGQDVQALINMYQGGKNLSQAAMAAKGGSRANIQWGASYVAKEGGNNYLVSEQRDPNTGETKLSKVLITGELTDKMGNTSKDNISNAIKKTEGVENAKVKVKLDTADDVAAIEAENARQRMISENQEEAAQESRTKAEAFSSQIRTIDEAIDALEEGAESGILANKFPSFKAATIKLENAANKLGIDVINSATFGALSAPELKLALSTAIPLDMDNDDLREYLLDKKSAMTKLHNELRKRASFLSKKGNTVAKWDELQAGKSETEEEVETVTDGDFTTSKGFKYKVIK